ncbi:protein FAM171B isoform X2 [Scleropages formosus]|uniref:protein FAM171B isoform X2 n=1 Tax=Scleropages formosus TaxID=113540 RepID=UPI0010FA961A|nr:protein FAM171B isoform X2 [Scleropages formosus]
MSLLRAYLALSATLLLCADARMLRGGEGLKDSADTAARRVSASRRRLLQLHGLREAAARAPESTFTLKIQVKDIASRQFLSQASVEVFVNHTQTNSALTAENGVAVLKVPYRLGLSLTIVARMDGYILTPLPWKTTRLPIFSSVTLSLFPQNQGNIWLFEDSIMITGKVSDALSQPSVQFPRNLLKLPDSRNISSVTAYLTVPQLPSEKDCFQYSVGILINKSGFRNVELSPVAAVSAHLLSDGKEIQVTGPIQITLPLTDNTGLRASDAVPAWAFDTKTGAWVNQGLGMVRVEEEGLVWTYVAPHLGYWIAAPLPSSRGYMGHETSMDFISYHTYLLMAILGGTLIIVVGFLTVLLCYCRGCICEAEKKRGTNVTRMVVLKKDQTTSTNNNRSREVSFKDSSQHDDRSYSRSGVQRDEYTPSRPNFNIYVEDVGFQASKMYEKVGNKGPESTRTVQSPIYVNSSEVLQPKEMGEQKMQLGVSENMFFPERLVHIYKQPVAILQAPELFHSPEQLAGCRSATFPRKGQMGNDGEPMSKDTFTQTLPKISLLSHLQQQSSEEQQVLEGPQSSASNPGTWGRYSSLLESVSVPGTLNEAVEMGPLCGELQGISEQTLLELSKGKPSQHPRAWFVSLEGKPVAQVRHSIIDLQKRHVPSDSNDTSLDSGVDMNEHQQGRRLEREKTFVKSMPHSRALYAEDLDLSSSESGTTAACTPEDAALRNILDSGSGSIPNIPEERDGADTSSAQEDSESRASPPPRRLRKVRDRSKVDKQKSTWHLREERPLMKLN